MLATVLSKSLFTRECRNSVIAINQEHNCRKTPQNGCSRSHRYDRSSTRLTKVVVLVIIKHGCHRNH